MSYLTKVLWIPSCPLLGRYNPRPFFSNVCIFIYVRYIITEHQYKLIIEQPMGLAPVGGYEYQKPQAIKKSFELTGLEPHTIMMIAGIGSAFIPVIGPLISLGIGLGDAAIYYNEGDTKTAGMVAMFSLLPGIGTIVNKLPFGQIVKQLGTKGMSALASKLSKGGGNLSKLESEVAQGISKNLSLIQQELNSHVKNLATQATTKPLATNVKNQLLNLSKKGLSWTAKNVVPYVGAGAGYEYTWNKFNPQQSINLANIDTKTISAANLKASKELEF